MEASAPPRFGELLRRYRLERGLTQQGLAERSNLSVEAIGLLERAGRTRPQRETIVHLVRALELSPERESTLRGALGETRPPLLSVVRADGGPRHEKLPGQRTSFVGRRREIAALVTLLSTERLVTVIGAGGVGKTRTVLQLAAETLDAYPDGLCFADLAPLADASLVASAVLSSLGLSGATGSALDVIVAHLKGRRLLLILDNCEHVIGRARELAERVSQACPSVRVVATSREPLHVAAERQFWLPSLAIPPESCLRAHAALAYDTVELFVDRAVSADATFALNDLNVPYVADICRRLDGIPLAIELSAARIATLAPRQISERLDRRFRLLTLGNPAALPRQQTMKASIDWSYDLLTPREQRFLAHLSIFSGGCSLEAVTAVCADVDEDDVDMADLIASLVSKSLLVAELAGEEQRYRLLESPRHYAREKLIARDEQQSTAQRHALGYLAIAQTLERDSDGISDRIWASRAKVELENWRAALEWSLVGRCDLPTGQRLASARKMIWRTFSPVEGRSWVRAALETVERDTPPDVVARLLHAEAEAAGQFGEREATLVAAERALAAYRKLGDTRGCAETQGLVGGALVLLGRIAEAEPLLAETLAVARILNDRRLLADTLQILGHLRSAQGHFGEARVYLSEALELAKVIDAEFITASVMVSMAENEFQAGNLDEAIRLTDAVLANLRALNASPALPGIAATLTNLATYLIAVGRYDEARVHAAESLELARGLRLVAVGKATLRLFVLVAMLQPPAQDSPDVPDNVGVARLCGFLDSQLATLGSEEYGLRREYEAALTSLVAAFGADDLRRYMLDGAAMSEEDAIAQAYALR